MDLSSFISLLNKDTIFSFGVINKVEVVNNGAIAYASVTLQPENREVQARISVPFSSSNGRITFLAAQGDKVLVVCDTSVSPVTYYIVAFFPSRQQLLPTETVNDSAMVIDAPRVNIGVGAGSPLVLGDVLLMLLQDTTEILKDIATLLRNGDVVLTTAPGVPTAANPDKTAYLQDKIDILTNDISVYLSDSNTNIISQKYFTKRI